MIVMKTMKEKQWGKRTTKSGKLFERLEGRKATNIWEY